MKKQLGREAASCLLASVLLYPYTAAEYLVLGLMASLTRDSGDKSGQIVFVALGDPYTNNYTIPNLR